MSTVVLGVSASIAAYKAADLASQLVKAGVDVFPVMTRDATRFLGPVSLAALTGHPCPVDIFDDPYPGEIAHIYLGKIADLIVVAPATMNLMARLAHGMGDDMLTATISATQAPVLLAPGMNTNMWQHPATQANISTLASYGYYFVHPVSGRLACRTEGVGKMADVPDIYDAVMEMLSRRGSLTGKKVLVTAGPTREPIDPVRFVSNRSSGKMGYAIAASAAARGADVVLVTGPVSLAPPPGVGVVAVETAEEMRGAALAEFDAADIVVAAAAVADYRPAAAAAEKIKKGCGEPAVLELAKTPDILAEMGRRKRGQMLIGFAAETENLLANAAAKLESKGLDMVVANDVTLEGAGFDTDTNIVTLLRPGREPKPLPIMSKRHVADAIFDEIAPPKATTQ